MAKMECVMGHRYRHLDDLVKCNHHSNRVDLNLISTLCLIVLPIFFIFFCLELMHLPAAMGWEIGF